MDELVEESRIQRGRSQPPGRDKATTVWTSAGWLRVEMGLEAIEAPARGKGHGDGRRSGGVLLVVVEGGEELGAARI